MLLSHYQLILFSYRGRPILSLRARGLTFLLFPMLLLILSAGNGFLLARWGHLQALKAREIRLQDERCELSQQTLLQTAALNDMENRVTRIMDFNTKLRIMLNIGDVNDPSAALAVSPHDRHGLQRLPVLFGRNHIREVRLRLDRVCSEMLYAEVRQQRISHAIAAQLETLGTIPVIMPTRGRFSSPFGWRNDPFNGGRRFHKGIDLTAPTGTPIRAAANGFITHVSRSPTYGLVIVITHSEELKTRYAHLSKVSVEEGQRVLRGQIIGYVGNTGRSKAPHLHYEVHQFDRPVNPRNYILQ